MGRKDILGELKFGNFMKSAFLTVFCLRIFNGPKPSLIITDPDLIAEVMIKKFDLFPNRVQVSGFSLKYFRKNIVGLQDEEWKKVRTTLSPTFTGMKLKKMTPFISGIGYLLYAKFAQILETDDQEFQLKPMFRSCTMDIICNIVFGINVDSEVSESYGPHFFLKF